MEMSEKTDKIDVFYSLKSLHLWTASCYNQSRNMKNRRYSYVLVVGYIFCSSYYTLN
jgi:hypothetical protein